MCVSRKPHELVPGLFLGFRSFSATPVPLWPVELCQTSRCFKDSCICGCYKAVSNVINSHVQVRLCYHAPSKFNMRLENRPVGCFEELLLPLVDTGSSLCLIFFNFAVLFRGEVMISFDSDFLLSFKLDCLSFRASFVHFLLSIRGLCRGCECFGSKKGKPFGLVDCNGFLSVRRGLWMIAGCRRWRHR